MVQVKGWRGRLPVALSLRVLDLVRHTGRSFHHWGQTADGPFEEQKPSDF